jgi:hypothetical protein
VAFMGMSRDSNHKEEKTIYIRSEMGERRQTSGRFRGLFRNAHSMENIISDVMTTRENWIAKDLELSGKEWIQVPYYELLQEQWQSTNYLIQNSRYACQFIHRPSSLCSQELWPLDHRGGLLSST